MFTDFEEYEFEKTRANEMSSFNSEYLFEVNRNITDLANETFNENSQEHVLDGSNNSNNQYEIPEQNFPIHELYVPQPENHSVSCLGRKRKNSLTEGPHNKYSEDNMIRKSKILVKDSLLEHINSQIKSEMNLSVIIDGKEYKNCKLLNIRPDNLIFLDAIEDKNLLKKKIRDILSDDISEKFHNYPKNYNKIIIDKIYEMENTENITRILDATFLKSIQFIRKDSSIFGEEEYSFLSGLERIFENSLKKKNKEKDYIEKLFYLIKNFEIILEKKIPRTKRPKKSG